MGKRWLVPVSLAAAALIATGCGSSSTSTNAGTGGGGGGGGGSGSNSSAVGPGTLLRTAKIGGATVLTNTKGFTLYWFVPDTSTTSKCNGQCAKFWPPVPAPATAGPNVVGRIGKITRADGSKQATWNGHPLYTYQGDTAPGQANGNGKNLSGGVWHEVTVSGAVIPEPTKSKKGGGVGYGY